MFVVHISCSPKLKRGRGVKDADDDPDHKERSTKVARQSVTYSSDAKKPPLDPAPESKGLPFLVGLESKVAHGKPGPLYKPGRWSRLDRAEAVLLRHSQGDEAYRLLMRSSLISHPVVAVAAAVVPQLPRALVHLVADYAVDHVERGEVCTQQATLLTQQVPWNSASLHGGAHHRMSKLAHLHYLAAMQLVHVIIPIDESPKKWFETEPSGMSLGQMMFTPEQVAEASFRIGINFLYGLNCSPLQNRPGRRYMEWANQLGHLHSNRLLRQSFFTEQTDTSSSLCWRLRLPANSDAELAPETANPDVELAPETANPDSKLAPETASPDRQSLCSGARAGVTKSTAATPLPEASDPALLLFLLELLAAQCSRCKDSPRTPWSCYSQSCSDAPHRCGGTRWSSLFALSRTRIATLDSTAHMLLAYVHTHGLVMGGRVMFPKDPTLALRHVKAASLQGHVGAQHMLAVLIEGLITAKTDSQPPVSAATLLILIHLYTVAAKCGHAVSAMRLASLQEIKASSLVADVKRRRLFLESSKSLYSTVLRTKDSVLPAQRRTSLLAIGRLRESLLLL